jgi:tetratricopeptide (TPR) repeat protein
MWVIAAIAVCAELRAEPCREASEALRRKDLAAAERLLTACTSQPGATVDAFLMLCGVYQLQGNSEGLYRAAVAGLKRHPAEPRFYLTAGTHAGRNRQFREAIGILEPAHKRWPDDARIVGLLESSHLGEGMAGLDAGDNDAALRHLERAVALAPGDVEAQLNLGRVLHNLHRGEEALEAFERAAAADPNVALANFHRGMTNYGLGRFAEAIADLDAEVAGNPDHAPARLVRGLARLAQGEWEAALADVRFAAQAMPDDSPAQFALGRCLLRLGKTDEAERALRRAMALAPEDAAPVNTLVRLLRQTGRAGEAGSLAARGEELGRKERSAAPGEIRFQSVRRPAR